MILFSFIFLTICAYAFSISKDDCPRGVDRDFYLEVHGNSCFEFATFLERDADDAEHYCQQNNGHLASIESEEVNNWITEKLRNTFGADENVWIGFNDRDSENDHEWLDGSEVSYSHWAPRNGPRSGLQILENAIDCAVLNADNGYWYDQQCREGIFNLWGLTGDYKKPFVCRYKVDVPEEDGSDASSEDTGAKPDDSEGRNEPSETGDGKVDGSETEAGSDKESESEPPVASDAEQNPKVDSEEDVNNGTTTESEKKEPAEQPAGEADTPGIPTEPTGKENESEAPAEQPAGEADTPELPTEPTGIEDESEEPSKQPAGEEDTPGLPTQPAGKEDEAQPEDPVVGEGDQNVPGEGEQKVGNETVGKAKNETEDIIRADIEDFYHECGEISCDKPCGMSGLKKDSRGCFLCECDD